MRRIYAKSGHSIVFVHGLGGHPRKTWSTSSYLAPASAEPRPPKRRLGDLVGRTVKRLAGTPPASDVEAEYVTRDGADEDDASSPATALNLTEALQSHEVFWPKDLLAEDFKTARILTFGYESNPRGPAQHNLYTLSNNLLSRLTDVREDCVRSASPLNEHSLYKPLKLTLSSQRDRSSSYVTV